MHARRPSWSAALVALLLSLWYCAPASAALLEGQVQEGSAEPEPERPPADPLGRGSPRGAIEGYLEAARERDFERAAEYLDLSRVPLEERAEAGPRLARQLKLVLDRVLWVEIDAMSSAPRGDLGDGLAPDLERIVGHATKEEPQGSFYLQRGARAPGSDETPIWRVAASTVERVPELWASFGPGAVAEVLPPTLIERSFLDIYLWQWIGLILLVFGAYLVGWLGATVLARFFGALARRSRSELDDRLVELMVGPASLVLTVAAFWAGISALKLSVPAEEFFTGLTKILFIVAVTWVVFRVIDLLAGITRTKLLARGQESTTFLIPLGSKTLKLVLSVLVVLSILGTFGFDVRALIAGLGVGGLAVALALQPTLQNVFGGVSVLVDEPVRPGQFCKFGDQMGIVEEVGLRSTRVRTLDRTVISIPNSDFANLRIENFARRDRIRLITTIGLRYETSADQLRHVLTELRRMLRAHPKVLPDPFRVRFVGFGAYSLDIELFAYIETTDINEFHAVREDLFLRIIDLVEASGTGFAFPSSTTYLARDGGLDAERTRAAEETVERWRTEGGLPFPDLAPETVEELRGALDWPPRGSVGAKKS